MGLRGKCVAGSVSCQWLFLGRLHLGPRASPYAAPPNSLQRNADGAGSAARPRGWGLRLDSRVRQLRGLREVRRHLRDLVLDRVELLPSTFCERSVELRFGRS